MHRQENKNLKAILIGILLILGVAVFTFLKPYWKNQPTEPTKQPATAKKESLGENRQISAGDLLQKITGNEEVVLWDIRGEEAYKKEHLPQSKNISDSALAAEISRIDPQKKYVLIDDGISGQAAEIIAGVFPGDGFQNITYLTGGFDEWKKGFNPTVSAGDPNYFIDQSKVTYLKSDELKKIMETETDLFLLDLRKSQQFQAGRLKDAQNIFLDELEDRKAEIPLEKKIILYDNDGLWAFQGAVRLYDLGFFNVFALSDGFTAWKQKGYEYVSENFGGTPEKN